MGSRSASGLSTVLLKFYKTTPTQKPVPTVGYSGADFFVTGLGVKAYSERDKRISPIFSRIPTKALGTKRKIALNQGVASPTAGLMKKLYNPWIEQGFTLVNIIVIINNTVSPTGYYPFRKFNPKDVRFVS